MSDSKSPGDYSLISAILSNYDKTKQYDLSKIIYSMMFTESIDETFISGIVNIVDSENYLDNFPIIGEETLEISIEDFFGEEYVWRMRVVATTDVKLDTVGTKQEYGLKVISSDFVNTDNQEIRRSFKGTPSNTAKKIFDDYFVTDRELDIDESDGDQTFVIPCKTPFETMTFLARKSFSIEYPSSSYRFFETRNDYKFATFEGLIKRGKEKTLKEDRFITYIDPKLLGSDSLAAMRNMVSYRPIQRFNLVNEMRQGGMVSELTLLDLGQKTVEEKVYKHYEQNDIEETDSRTRDYHTQKYIRDNFQKENSLARYIVYNDTTKPDQYYDNILPKRISTEYYLGSISMQATMYGSLDLTVGDVVYVDLPKPEVARDDEEHNTLSGFYIVRKILHQYGMNDWMMDVQLSKTSLRGELT